MSVLHWGSAPWTDVAATLARDPIVFLPIGAMEAHGPHLSNDADTVIATAVATRAAAILDAANTATIVLPSLQYGVCKAAYPFAGTIDLDADLLTRLIVNICGEVARHGGRRFCLNVHHWDPPHLEAIDKAVAELRGRQGISCALFDRRSLNDEQIKQSFGEGEGTGVRHGGRVETSMVLASEPSHVDPERMAQLPAVWIDLMPRLRAGARDFAEAGGTDAYFGEPAVATADEGRLVLEYLAEQVVRLAADLE